LAGDALSIYYFGASPLPDQRVRVTFDRLLSHGAVYWNDGFAGFRVLSQFDGSYISSGEFIGKDSFAGNYHNGGSWLLFDALALYSAAAHGVIQAGELLLQRISSEYQRSRAFHEYIRTSPFIVDARPDYGWNSFVVRLLA
ncbi:MAG TPA: hypothetical protein VF157_03760, partial [Chloroflexota bacterium]